MVKGVGSCDGEEAVYPNGNLGSFGVAHYNGALGDGGVCEGLYYPVAHEREQGDRHIKHVQGEVARVLKEDALTKTARAVIELVHNGD